MNNEGSAWREGLKGCSEINKTFLSKVKTLALFIYDILKVQVGPRIGDHPEQPKCALIGRLLKRGDILLALKVQVGRPHQRPP
jgi:hypothetical protein